VTPPGSGSYSQGPVYPGQMPVLTQAPREFQVIGELDYESGGGY
jgi:hypothetical protein